MKIKILLTAFLVISLSLSATAQSQFYRSYFGEEFTKWYVFCSIFDSEDGVLLQIDERDTVLLNGVTYKQVNDSYNYLFGIREDRETGSLFINDGWDTEILVSKMALGIGDKFYFPSFVCTDEYCDCDCFYHFDGTKTDEKGIYAVVDSVYYIDGRKHVRLNCDYVHYMNDIYSIPVTFIEGIGPNISFERFHQPYYYAAVASVNLLCYETENDSWKQIYWEEMKMYEEKFGCEFHRGGNIPAMEETVPFNVRQLSDVLEITAENVKQGVVRIYSLDGNLLINKAFNGNPIVVIPMLELPAGSYIIVLWDNKTRKQWNIKWMKL
ncbi:MAG: hypothetical protein LBG28_00120 [Tannerella sp.]|jgi:hypothetical protein|nr:hypothetical protein [Tannerella sp.]